MKSAMEVDVAGENAMEDDFESVFTVACFRWIDSFTLEHKPALGNELASAVSLFELLSRVLPKYFDLSTINTAASNPAEYCGNLRQLLSSLRILFESELGESMPGLSSINIEEAAKGEVVDLFPILQLSVYATIKVEASKEIAIQKITELDGETQAALMKGLSQVMHGSVPGSPASSCGSAAGRSTPGSTRKSPTGRSNSRTPQRPLDFGSTTPGYSRSSSSPALDQTTRPIHTARLQNVIEVLQSENRTLKDQVGELTDKLDKSTEKNLELKDLVDAREAQAQRVERAMAKNSNTQQETRLQDAEAKAKKYKNELNIHKQEAAMLSQKLREREQEIEEMKHLAEQEVENVKGVLREQQDKVDIAQSKLKKLTAMEGKFKRIQKRLEDFDAVKNKLEEVQGSNDKHVEELIKLRTLNKQIPLLEEQMKKYKSEMIEYQVRCTTLQDLPSNVEEAISNYKDQISNLEEEKRHLTEQLKLAKDEGARLSELQASSLAGMEEAGSSALEGMDAVDQKVRDRLQKLEAENKRLRSGLDKGAHVTRLEDDLNTQRTLAQSLRKQLGETTKKLRDSERQFQELKTSTTEIIRTSISKAEKVKLDETIASLKEQVASLEGELAKQRGLVETRDGQLTTIKAELETEQKAKEVALERNRNALEQIETKLAIVREVKPALDNMRKSLEECRTKCTKLENENEKLRSVQEKQAGLHKQEMLLKDRSINREQRLMASAFYNMVGSVHRQQAGISEAASTDNTRPLKKRKVASE